MIKRAISQKILKTTKEYPVLLITGPRQSGKTTLVKELFGSKKYVNLEDLETRDFALRDPKGFISQNENGLIVDEVQRAPQLLSQIQVAVDQDKPLGRFILTGSQNILLMEGVSQSLAGRVAIFNLLPLSLSEIGKPDEDLDQFLFKGLYPRIYDKNADPSGYYQNYIQTYVERDVRLIRNISDLSSFKRFLDLCAGRCGQILNYASLAQDCGISHATAKDWISLLEASFVIHLLRPFHKNYHKRVIKMPKLYFYDTGLLCALLNIANPGQLASHFLKGAIFETFVINEIIKRQLAEGAKPSAYFWRDKTGHEVDLVLEKGGKEAIIEIKSGQTISQDFFKGLDYYNSLSGQNDTYVVYGGAQKQDRQNGKVVPWKDLPENMDKILL